MACLVSLIIPVLDEGTRIGECLDRLRELTSRHEVIVVDGGSQDGTVEAVEVRPWVHLAYAKRGRGAQMNAGARLATHGALLFLHADMWLPAGALEAVEDALEDLRIIGGGFLKTYRANRGQSRTSDLASRSKIGVRSRFCGGSWPWLEFLEWGLNVVRTRLFGDLVGTNAIFVRAATFTRLGGFREWPLLEDVDFSDRLKIQGQIAILDGPVEVSPRKYERDGVLLRAWTNARVMFGYRVLRQSPEALAVLYRSGAGREVLRGQSLVVRVEDSDRLARDKTADPPVPSRFVRLL